MNKLLTTYTGISFFLSILFCMFFSSSIFSQENTFKDKTKKNLSEIKNNLFGEFQYSYSFEWEEIKGNNGYAIQVKNNNDEIIHDLTVETNQVEFSVPLGDYMMRLSPLDRKKKPSKWSEWNPFRVDKETAKAKTNIWTVSAKIFPCLGFFGKKKPLWASSCFIWSAALGTAFYIEKKAGDNIANQDENDPVYLTILSYYQPLLFSLKMINDKRSDKKKYDTHQRNQRSIAALGAITYLAYLFYMFDGFGLLALEYRAMDIRDISERKLEEKYYSNSNVFEYRYTVSF